MLNPKNLSPGQPAKFGERGEDHAKICRMPSPYAVREGAP